MRENNILNTWGSSADEENRMISTSCWLDVAMTSIKTGDSMIVKYYVRMKTFLKTEVQFSHKIKEAILGVEFKELCQM